MSTHKLPAVEYYASLPKAIFAAGAIFYDSSGRILLVKTNYGKEIWEIPGGAADHGEFPMDTAKREIKEELGIDQALGGLLVVDWVSSQPDGRPPLVNFLFDGGLITPEWAEANLVVDKVEISKWHLATSVEWAAMLPPVLARRVDVCAEVLADHPNATAYLHEGYKQSIL